MWQLLQAYSLLRVEARSWRLGHDTLKNIIGLHQLIPRPKPQMTLGASYLVNTDPLRRIGRIYLQLAEGDLRDDLRKIVLNTASRQNQHERDQQKDERHQAGDVLAHATLELRELKVFPDDVVRFGCLDHLRLEFENKCIACQARKTRPPWHESDGAYTKNFQAQWLGGSTRESSNSR